MPISPSVSVSLCLLDVRLTILDVNPGLHFSSLHKFQRTIVYSGAISWNYFSRSFFGADRNFQNWRHPLSLIPSTAFTLFASFYMDTFLITRTSFSCVSALYLFNLAQSRHTIFPQPCLSHMVEKCKNCRSYPCLKLKFIQISMFRFAPNHLRRNLPPHFWTGDQACSSPYPACQLSLRNLPTNLFFAAFFWSR